MSNTAIVFKAGLTGLAQIAWKVQYFSQGQADA